MECGWVEATRLGPVADCLHRDRRVVVGRGDGRGEAEWRLGHLHPATHGISEEVIVGGGERDGGAKEAVGVFAAHALAVEHDHRHADEEEQRRLVGVALPRRLEPLLQLGDAEHRRVELGAEGGHLRGGAELCEGELPLLVVPLELLELRLLLGEGGRRRVLRRR